MPFFPPSPQSPQMGAVHARPNKRIMVFVDGENLVIRYQEMLKKGYVPRDDMDFHEPDVAVWNSSFTFLARFHEIIRATYYTSMVGTYDDVDAVRKNLKALSFSKHDASLLPNSLTPCVLKKKSKSQKSKGVDIQLCADVLSHVYRGNTDAILLISGDGDFEPLIEEVLRAGVQVFLSALSHGLNPRLPILADQFYELDGTTWKEKPA